MCSVLWATALDQMRFSVEKNKLFSDQIDDIEYYISLSRGKRQHVYNIGTYILIILNTTFSAVMATSLHGDDAVTIDYTRDALSIVVMVTLNKHVEYNAVHFPKIHFIIES